MFMWNFEYVEYKARRLPVINLIHEHLSSLKCLLACGLSAQGREIVDVAGRRGQRGDGAATANSLLVEAASGGRPSRRAHRWRV